MKGYQQNIKKNYIELVKKFDILPPDCVVSILTGNTESNCSMVRKELEDRGYKFKHIPRKSIRLNGRILGEWHVIERPQTVTTKPDKQAVDMQQFKREIVSEIMTELERKYGQYNQNQ